ncbi:MAG: hypothetical protein RLZZ490_2327, partial [Cyanobacteriota bacterium]
MTDSDSLESILADMHKKYVQGSEKSSKNLVEEFPLTQENKQQHPTLDKLLNELKQDFQTNQFPIQADKITPVEKEKIHPLDSELDRLVTQQKAQNQKI